MSARPPAVRAPSFADRSRQPPLVLYTLALLALAGAARADDAASVAVGAVVLSKSVCKLNTTSATLAFGAIQAASDSPATASATLALVCHGSAPLASYALTHDSGRYEPGPNAPRMRHATLGEYLPYQLSITPAMGTIEKNSTQTIVLEGTILPDSFQNAAPGTYTDQLVVTLVP